MLKVEFNLTSMSLSLNSITESALRTIFQSLLSLMELTLAQSPCRRQKDTILFYFIFREVSVLFPLTCTR